MSPHLQAHRESISDLCSRYGVRTLDVFGSAVDDRFDLQHSDVDFIVEFSDTRPEGAADRYFGLLEELQRLLSRPVDLIVRGAIRNPYFLHSADSQRVNLYAA
jgi:predicted nucleotidyltransferase